MKILIVDDETLARERLRALLAEIGIGQIIGEAANGKEALRLVQAHRPDVILLDIRMPAMDGMQAAEALLAVQPAASIIFTTAYGDRALEAFEKQAVDYLLKPIRKERLEQALRKTLLLKQSLTEFPEPKPSSRTHISYYVRGELRLVPVKDVYYFYCHQKYVVLRWRQGEILVSETLKELEKEFAGQFLRIHRSTLVAMVQIAALMKDGDGHSYVKLKDLDQKLEISRRHLQLVKKVLKDMRIPFL
jgi:two-component system response regulator AlgR